MKLSVLSKILEENVPKIPYPKEKLEQYTTPAELALKVALRALSYIKGTVVADLGAGTCRIAIASLLLGADKAVAIDLDPSFPPLCLEAAKRLGLDGRLIYIISKISSNLGLLRNIDVVIMNPPFGVKKRGADREFLEYSMKLKVPLIIAIVKSGNLNFHEKLALKEGYRIRLLWSEWFPIPASLPRHRSRIRRVLVDVIELRRASDARS